MREWHPYADFDATIRGSAVAVAQLVESQIVILVVVGSSPISHPKCLLKAPVVRRALFFGLVRGQVLNSELEFFLSNERDT